MTDKKQQQIFTANINYYINQENKTQREIADCIGVSPQTFNTWVQGIAIPRMGKIQALADYFGIKKSDLIEERKPDTIEPPQQEVAGELNNSEQFLIDVYRGLNEDGKDRLVDYADDLHSMDKYKKGDYHVSAQEKSA